jgi:hypothetical protein
MPGVDPKGPNAADGAGPGGARAGGRGAGLGRPGLDARKPAGVPVAGLSTKAVMGGVRSPRLGGPGGQASGAGSSGSSAPPGGGGGQRGPSGKEHKANKSLRRKRDGEFGEPDAVVPVIGDDGPDTEVPESLAPRTTPPTAVPAARRSPPVTGTRQAGAEQLRAELEL